MTSDPIDPYAILGLARDATAAEISAAYRTLLRRYHPDTRAPADHSHDEDSDAMLQHVLAAYTLLHDLARRFDDDRHTSPRTPPTRPIHLRRRFDGPPLRAGPVHWTR